MIWPLFWSVCACEYFFTNSRIQLTSVWSLVNFCCVVSREDVRLEHRQRCMRQWKWQRDSICLGTVMKNVVLSKILQIVFSSNVSLWVTISISIPCIYSYISSEYSQLLGTTTQSICEVCANDLVTQNHNFFTGIANTHDWFPQWKVWGIKSVSHLAC